MPIVLLLAAALVSPSMALAAGTTTSKEGLSGYGKEEPKKEEPKKTEEPKKEEPKSGTSPSKETTPPTKETAPESKSTAPSESAKSSTLPFTGLDLRVIVGIGVLMLAAGFSIVAVQRRQRRR